MRNRWHYIKEKNKSFHEFMVSFDGWNGVTFSIPHQRKREMAVAVKIPEMIRCMKHTYVSAIHQTYCPSLSLSLSCNIFFFKNQLAHAFWVMLVSFGNYFSRRPREKSCDSIAVVYRKSIRIKSDISVFEPNFS